MKGLHNTQEEECPVQSPPEVLNSSSSFEIADVRNGICAYVHT